MAASFVCLLLFLLNVPAHTQEIPKLHVKHIGNEKIILDGNLSEPAWQQAETATDFWQFMPNDSVKARYQTEVKAAYNDKYLYFAVKAYAPGKNYVVTSLRRDFDGRQNDNVVLLFDTFKDGQNGYAFGITPYGVQREVWIGNGGSTMESFNVAWDMKWKAEARRYDSFYVVEAEIPFTSMKFKEGSTSWRFRPFRWNLQTNEQSTWVRVPQTQLLANLAFMGELVFEKPLGKSRTPFALIPYINGLTQNDRGNASSKFTTGADAKFSIGDGLNLDLTLNPDFSNVEVDDIFTNLTRFELFLPERRQFFIDNNDLFANLGNTFNEARPFFSRRIGLSYNKNGNLVQNRIPAGARLSGKVDENWRLGLLNMQTAADTANGIAAFNNGMFILQRKMFTRSNISAFIINRQVTRYKDKINSSDHYNRVWGMDYNLASADNRWSGRFYLHQSAQPGDSKGNLSAQAVLTYNYNNWVIINDLVHVDKDFRSDLGFVPRTDFWKIGNGIIRNFFPKNRNFINRFTARGIMINYFRPSDNMRWTDNLLWGTFTTEFKNLSSIEANLRREYIYLFWPFDPARKPGGTPLPANTKYHFTQASLQYQTNNTGRFTSDITLSGGSFFNGHSYSIAWNAGFRFQPKVNLTTNIRFDAIRLPAPYSTANYWLFTQRADITFSKSLFWNTTIQFRSQSKNIGINTRLQWRYAQLSDLFIVYNDNYTSDSFSPRFRSLNLKLTYWLNVK